MGVNPVSKYLLAEQSVGEELDSQDMIEGVVVSKGRGQYLIETVNGTIPCVISSILRKKLVYPYRDPNSLTHYEVQNVDRIEMVDPLAIGDRVRFLDAGDGTGMVKQVLERKSTFSRRDPGPIPLEQVIVANVDQVIAVFSAARPKPQWRLLDRYLVLAEIADIPTVICINSYVLELSCSILQERKPILKKPLSKNGV